MKKIAAVIVPGLIVILLVVLGFRLGSVPQNAGTQPDTSFIEAIIRPENSRPEPETSFDTPVCPSRREAVAFMKQYTAEGYTVLDAGNVYGTMPGMDVYGVYPGENCPADAVWQGHAAIEVYLYHAQEKTDEPMTAVAILVYPDGRGEEECEKLVHCAGEIFDFLAPEFSREDIKNLKQTDAYMRLMDCAARYAGKTVQIQPEPAVNESFPAGKGELLLVSHETYRYIEIALKTARK